MLKSVGGYYRYCCSVIIIVFLLGSVFVSSIFPALGNYNAGVNNEKLVSLAINQELNSPCLIGMVDSNTDEINVFSNVTLAAAENGTSITLPFLLPQVIDRLNSVQYHLFRYWYITDIPPPA